MVKEIQVTCRNCKKKINKSTAYHPSGRLYFCDEHCYEEYKTPKVACYVCKKEHKTSDMTYYLGHYVCADCFDDWINQEDTQRDAFIDYVWNLYDDEYRVPSLYMTIRKQAEYYHKQYNMKYKGMLLAAKYHIDILEKRWYNEYGLGQLLPQTYEKLKEQYAQQHALKKKLNNVILNKDEHIVIARNQNVRRKMLNLE